MKQLTALITGGSGGIGSSIAEKLAQTRTNLIIQYNNNENKARQLVDDLTRKYAVKVYPIKMNLNSDVDIKKIMNSLPDVNILVHAAGLPIKYSSLQDKGIIKNFGEQYNLTINSFVKIIQFCLPKMQKNQWGRIIGIASALVYNVPTNKLSPYITAKSALIGLCKSLAVEFAPFNITVNSISPGVIDTNFLDDFPVQMKQLIIPKIPLKRIGVPQDVSGLINFLCSEDAGYITGVNIPIAGGMVM